MERKGLWLGIGLGVAGIGASVAGLTNLLVGILMMVLGVIIAAVSTWSFYRRGGSPSRQKRLTRKTPNFSIRSVTKDAIKIEPYSRKKEWYASLKIHNMTDAPIECRGYPKRIEYWDGRKWEDAESILNSGLDALEWNGNRSEFIVIYKNNPAVVNVAKPAKRWHGDTNVAFTIRGSEGNMEWSKYRVWVQIQDLERESLSDFYGCVQATFKNMSTLESGMIDTNKVADTITIKKCKEAKELMDSFDRPVKFD